MVMMLWLVCDVVMQAIQCVTADC